MFKGILLSISIQNFETHVRHHINDKLVAESSLGVTIELIDEL